jgi:uncharacterized protein (TIGR02145 family)
MKTTFRKFTHLVAISAIILLQSCSDDDDAAVAPKVSTVDATEITFSSAKLGGSITSSGGAVILAKGIAFSTSPNPTVANDTTNQGEGKESFSVTLTELLPNTTYYARAYAINKAGTNYGQEFSFITQTGAPVVSLTMSNISYEKALATFLIDDIGASSITGNGFVYSDENTVPTIMDIMWPSNSAELTAEKLMTGLTPGTTYYFRAYAQNAQGRAYSDVIEITTLAIPQATDVDGNTYASVMIGDQIWMAENLRVTKFSNGDAIPTTASLNQNISAETTPQYQWAAGGDDANIPTYGRLYTSYVVIDNRNVCPSGWHVPTYAEFTILMAAAGNNGNKLKTVGTDEWNHNLGTNELNFDGVGAGVRLSNGTFNFFKTYSETWAATEYSATEHNNFMLYSQYNYIDQYWRDKSNGLSVRCLKN